MQMLVTLAVLGSMWYELYNVDITGHTGRIAVQVYVPTIPRYVDGSPVVVAVKGGFEKDSFFRPVDLYPKFGITYVTFLFPGGYDPETHRSSEGVYDARGPNCLSALYDVLRYAHGDIPAVDGTLITELSPFPIDTTVIGMVAFSNGGNLTVDVLDIWGDSLSFVDYLVNWESPTSSQTILTELGSHDCDTTRDGNGNGFYDDDRVNPYYISYRDTVCIIDYSRIAYDSTYPPREGVFLDGNANGAIDLAMSGGCEWEDVTNDGILTPGEDYRLSNYHYRGKYFLSTEATKALRNRLSTWPPELADTGEVDTFWWWREAVMHFDNAASKVPNLAVILVFSKNDHVQVAIDKPHIHQAYSGWSRNGIWVRLNPDEEYARHAAPPGPPGLPDNDANHAPANWNTIVNWAIDERYNSVIIAAAGVAELCDRTKFNVWANDLSGVLAPPKPTLYFNLGVHLEETPGYLVSRYVYPFAQNYEMFAESLAAHGGVLANQFDWTVIEGFEHYRPGLLADLEAMGHEVTPHAHETVYSLREVKILLDEAGVSAPFDGNGHMMGAYWTRYMAENTGVYHASYNKMVYTATNISKRLTPWRPHVDTMPRSWLTHDPHGPIVFAANYGIAGDPEHHDMLTTSLLITSAAAAFDRVNARSCFVWGLQHTDTIPILIDSLGPMFEQVDTLVGRGIVTWASMDSIYRAYLAWEAAHPGVNPVTDTFRVTPPDTTHYAVPPGWTVFTEWDDTTAGIPVLPNNVVTSIDIDKFGKVWIGTHGGLAVTDGATWRWITPNNSSLPAWYVRVVRASYDGIWVGTDYAGLVKLDFRGRVIAIIDTTGGILPSVGVHEVYVAHDSTVWVGMFHGGVAVLDHGTWTYYDTSNGLPDNDVFAITEYRDTIYVGTSGGGVAKFDGTGFVTLPTIGSGGIGGNYVHALKSTPFGLLAGTFGYGVARFDGSTWSLIGPDSMPVDPTSAIYPAGIEYFHDTLFVSDYGGNLKFKEPGGWRVIPVPSNGNATQNVYTFTFDTLRNLLWIGTIRGVKVLNRLSAIGEGAEGGVSNGPQLAVTFRGIRFNIPDAGDAELEIYDISGRKVKSWSVSGQGWHTLAIPNELPSGVYLVSLKHGSTTLTGKLIRVK